MQFRESKYLMTDGRVRLAKMRPSYGVHRANIDVDLALLKMYRASMKENGFIVSAGAILHGHDAQRFITAIVHRKVNKFDERPMSKRDRDMANERVSIAVQNGFHRGSQWSTMVNKACQAFVICKARVKNIDDVEKFPKDPYIASLVKIITRIGLGKFEMILRNADTNDSVSQMLISDAIVA